MNMTDDMELVIKMPKEKYDAIKNNSFPEKMKECFGLAGPALEAIRHGTPLPKGHRRLIIEPTKKEIEKTVGGQNDFADYGRDCVKAVLDNAETIIEADTEESEE